MECKSIQNKEFKCPTLEYMGLEKISETFSTKIQNQNPTCGNKAKHLTGSYFRYTKKT